MKICHNMNIVVQTTVGDASSLGGKSECLNKTLANITWALILNSSHKKELWCFSYQYFIWIFRQTDNILCGDIPYLLCNVTRPSYKHIKLLGVIFYIINGRVTRKKIMIYHYIPVAHVDSFRINIFIADMHRLTAIILDVSTVFQNKNVPIH